MAAARECVPGWHGNGGLAATSQLKPAGQGSQEKTWREWAGGGEREGEGGREGEREGRAEGRGKGEGGEREGERGGRGRGEGGEREGVTVLISMQTQLGKVLQ